MQKQYVGRYRKVWESVVFCSNQISGTCVFDHVRCADETIVGKNTMTTCE